MMNFNFASRTIQIVILVFLSFIWGSSFILMKRSLEVFPPNEIAASRIFLVFLVLFPLTFKHRFVLKRNNFLAFLAVGVFGSALPYFLFVTAQTKISSSLSGVLNSLTPLFTLLFALLFFKQKIRLLSIVGVALGLLGAIGLIYFSEEHNVTNSFTIYMLLPIIASASYGMNVNIVKISLQNINPVAITALSFVFIGPFAGLYLFVSTDFVRHLLLPEGWVAFGYIAILAIIGTAVAVLIFNILIRYTTALFASSVTYLIPVIAIFWGVLDGEVFNLIQLIFTVIVLGGISLIRSSN